MDSSGEGNGTPLQYSCLENPMDGGYSPWGCKESDTTEQIHYYYYGLFSAYLQFADILWMIFISGILMYSFL